MSAYITVAQLLMHATHDDLFLLAYLLNQLAVCLHDRNVKVSTQRVSGCLHLPIWSIIYSAQPSNPLSRHLNHVAVNAYSRIDLSENAESNLLLTVTG